MIAEFDRRLAQPLPRVPEIIREVTRERRLGGRPAIVRFPFFNPLLAVITLAPGHAVILRLRVSRSFPRLGTHLCGSLRSTMVNSGLERWER